MAAATFVLIFGFLGANLAELYTEARQIGIQSLYNSTTDYVVVMDNSTLDKATCESPKAWMVEFYSSWCGHCVHFAPTYALLAKDVKDWKDIIDVGAINCALATNMIVCRNHHVNAFPSFVIFKPYTKFNTTAETYHGGRDLGHLRHALITVVESYVPDSSRKHTWPNLNPVNASWIVEFFQRSNTANVKYLAVVFEDSQSYQGREFILDMTPYRSDVTVCRTLMTDNLLVDKWFIQDFPALFVIEKDLSPTVLSLSGTRETFKQRLLQFLGKTISLKDSPKPKNQSAKLVDIGLDKPKIDVPDTRQPVEGGIKTEGAQIPALAIAGEEKFEFRAKSQDKPQQLQGAEEAAEDSLKDDFEAGEENALIPGLAIPDDFNAGLDQKVQLSKDMGKGKDLSQMAEDKMFQSQQVLWDKVHQKGKEKAKTITPKKIQVINDRPPIHMLDLESTLHYALRHEIPLHGVLKGKPLEALTAFVSVLSRYFPGRPQVMNYLESIRFWLEDSKVDEISSDDWLNFVNRQYDPEMPEDAFLPKQITWIGCKGSEPHYRGYPCGLWMLFHMLTTSHVTTNRMIDDPNVFEVLHAMKGFIKHFFTCRECSKNFAKESATLDLEIKTLDESILWLWRIHNRVNQRLHGDQTEDPKHPKILFPPANICLSCRGGEDAMWREKSVLIFLKDFYGLKNINFDNLGTELDESDHRVTKGQSAQEVKRRVRERFRQKEVELRLQRVEGKLGGGYFGLGVNGLDLSLCLVLYFMCSVLVTFIYLLIWRRRRRRKLPKYSV